MVKKVNSSTAAERTFFEGGSGGSGGSAGGGVSGSSSGSGDGGKGKGNEVPQAGKAKSVEDSSPKGEKKQGEAETWLLKKIRDQVKVEKIRGKESK